MMMVAVARSDDTSSVAGKRNGESVVAATRRSSFPLSSILALMTRGSKSWTVVEDEFSDEEIVSEESKTKTSSSSKEESNFRPKQEPTDSDG